MTYKSELRVWLNRHKNIMTPDIIALHELMGGYYIEVCEGTDFNNKPIFGVTLWKESNGPQPYTNHTPEISAESAMFYSKEEAEEHVKYMAERVALERPREVTQ